MNTKKIIIFAATVFAVCAIIVIGIVGNVNKTKEEMTTDEDISYEDMSELESETTIEVESETEKTVIEDSTTMVATRENDTKLTTVATTKETTTKETTISETTTKETTTEAITSNPTDGGASYFYLSDYERRVVECVVMGESGGESYEGQVLVAQCILNACIKEGLQPSQVRNTYQYSGWNSYPSESVKRAVSAVFDNGCKITNEKILYFYAPEYCSSPWHESQKFVREVGGHRFFAEW